MKTVIRTGLLFSLLFFGACSSAPKKPASDAEPVKLAKVDSTGARILTVEGENTEAYFSPDGSHILYRSEKRVQHQHPQIYEMDLATLRERRVTFHDGEDSCAYYHPNGSKIFYASTTDEIKDEKQLEKSTTLLNSTAVGEPIGELPPFEIYESGLDGTNIERITNSEGYDSEVSVHPSGHILLFSSIRSGDLELHSLDLATRGVRRLTHEPGADGGGFFSPKGHQIVWRHFNPEMTVSQIMIANSFGGEAKALTTKRAIHWAPFWHPGGKDIIFSSNRDDAQNFELYTVDIKGLCLKRLTFSPGTDTNPSFSPDGTKVLFTSNRSGKNQIYLMDYRPPAACMNELP